jgi:predicted GNAT superfamily acetyltransferase
VFSTEPGFKLQSIQGLQSLQVVHIKQVHPGVQALIVSQFDGDGTGVGVGVGVGVGLGQSCTLYSHPQVIHPSQSVLVGLGG